MPTYSFRCQACDNAFDIQQSMNAPAPSACPACGGKLRKLFAAVGISFTGSGFYRTDSRPAPNGASGASTTSTAGSGSTASSPAAPGTNGQASGA